MPTSRFILLSILLSVKVFYSVISAQPVSKDTFQVWFFLLEECKITQAFIPVMNNLSREYRTDTILFAGVFPSPMSTPQGIQDFINKYDPAFPIESSSAMDIARRMGISVMPEVAVWNVTKKELVYRGRINNMFERVGKRRQVVNHHELRDALNAVRKGTLPEIRETGSGRVFFRVF